MLKNKFISILLIIIIGILFFANIKGVYAEGCPQGTDPDNSQLNPVDSDEIEKNKKFYMKEVCVYRGKCSDGDRVTIKLSYNIKTGGWKVDTEIPNAFDDSTINFCAEKGRPDTGGLEIELSGPAADDLKGKGNEKGNIVCPKYAYYDVSGLNEVCFDNGRYCHEDTDTFKNTPTIKLKKSKTATVNRQNKKQAFLESDESKLCIYENSNYNAYIRYVDTDDYYTIDVFKNGKKDSEHSYDGGFYRIFSPLYDGFGGIDNYISINAIDALKRGKCPAALYFDNDGFTEACLDMNSENDDYCVSRTDNTFEYEDSLDLVKSNEALLKKVSKSEIADKNKVDDDDCKGILDVNIINWLQKLLNVFKIIAPLLVLGLTIFDFIKSVVSQNQDSLKKASNLFIKRFIIMALLFFLPTIIAIVLKMLAIDAATCGIK